MVLLYPLTTEKSVAAIEKQNKITFIVEEKATKKTIKERVEKVYAEKVKSVNIVNTFHGKKKAIVAFVKPGAAADVAAKLKII